MTPETCDSCNARAVVYYAKGPDLLSFCGHHAGAMNTALTVLGWEPFSVAEVTA